MMHERIHRDPQVMMGKPVIRGTRITVELLLRECARGASFEEIIDSYPRVTEADIRAALAFAADYLSHEGLVAAE
ncbi:MAG TPA: DUF433 domain-containing protein [Caulobacteraceae bacterium]|nr:DUF433 domain-containing protein [Caulobacteraceae bacterium]